MNTCDAQIKWCFPNISRAESIRTSLLDRVVSYLTYWKESYMSKRIFFAFVSSLFVACEAMAGAFALREQSTWFQGMSYAGNATATQSLSSIFWNPATAVEHDGLWGETTHTFVIPRGTIDLDSATIDAGPAAGPIQGLPYSSGDVGVDAWLPTGYGTWSVTDRFSLGVSANAPYGLSTKPDINWAGQVYARSSRVFSINLTPIAAFKVSDKFSIGAGWQLQYFQVRLKSANGVPPSPDIQNVELRGEDYNLGFGATVGALYKPWEGTQIGIGYRSPIEHNLKGRLIVGGGSGEAIRADVIMPEMVTVSFQQELRDDWRAYGTFEWTHWSRFGTFPVNNLAGVQLTDLPFQYNDGYFISLGTEYEFTQRLSGRFGVAYEWSPINEENRTPRLPDSNRFWLSAGLSYNYAEWLSLDLGYSHVFPESSRVNINPAHPFYEGISIDGPVNNANIDLISGAVRVRF